MVKNSSPSTPTGTLSINCTQCGRELRVEVEKVLEIGRENLICMECAQAAEHENFRESRFRPELSQSAKNGRSIESKSAPSSSGGGIITYLHGLGDVILEIVSTFFVLMAIVAVLSVVVPSLMGSDVIFLLTLIAGLYILNIAHLEESWFAAGVGLLVTLRSIGGLIDVLGTI